MHSGKKVIHLHAGDLIFGKGQCLVKTLLGSCVSIILWQPEKKLCGVCHFAYPENINQDASEKLDARYCTDCIEIFRNEAYKESLQLDSFNASVIGGAKALPQEYELYDDNLDVDDPWQNENIGDVNASMAIKLLDQLGVVVTKIDAGGQGYRKLRFDTGSGRLSAKFYPI